MVGVIWKKQAYRLRMRDGVLMLLVMACPVCQEFGRIGSLELRQINAREAVYVCSNSQVR